ncbi:patatin-like phospholipase family protein [Gordonia lacunae]|uniref:patatin-like phospholipase family protein n=1 Tax=Gordonia lacunae TaxID=417102 RepID=UPI0039E3F9E0
MTRTAVVIGCGGTIGGAWIVAALAALAGETGLNPSEVDLLQGTSAGAELVTMLASGTSIDELVAMHRGHAGDRRLRDHIAATPPGLPPLPSPRPLHPALVRRRPGLAGLTGLAPTGRGDAAWLQRLGEAFTTEDGWLPHSDARMIAYDVGTGERVALGAPTAPPVSVGEALRASWAIPGWMPPVRLGESVLVDGGAASTASVDLLVDDNIDLAYVIAPMASVPGQRPPGLGGVIEDRILRRPMSATLTREIAVLRSTGTSVIPIVPSTDDLRGLGANFMRRSHRRAAFEAAMTTVPVTVRAALSENASHS